MKRKNRIISIVFTASISVMMVGVLGYAAAGEGVISGAFFAGLPPVSLSGRDARSYRFTVNPFHNRNVSNRVPSPALLFTEKWMQPPDEAGQMEWAPAKTTGLQLPGDDDSRTGARQPLLGLGWDRDGGSRNRWNIVFGLGLYISNYRDGYHTGEDIGLKAPEPDGERTDLFEKIQNALQVVGFQVRYDF